MITSPDGKLQVQVVTGKLITYSIKLNGITYLRPSVISMQLANGKELGTSPVIKKEITRAVNNVLHPLYGITRDITEKYNELRIDLAGDYMIVQQTLKRGDTINIHMAPGGGFALRLTPKIQNSKSIEGQQQRYRVIMFGNSLIENGGDWNKLLNRKDVKNSGRGGFTTSHFVWLLKDQVLKYKPEICFLEGGVNDIGVGIPLERIKKNYQSMVDTLLAHHIKPVLNAVLYTNQPASPGDRKRDADKIDAVNTFLLHLSKGKNIPMIDLNPQLSSNRTLNSQYTTDGVHLTNEAYDIWVNAIKNILSSID